MDSWIKRCSPVAIPGEFDGLKVHKMRGRYPTAPQLQDLTAPGVKLALQERDGTFFKSSLVCHQLCHEVSFSCATVLFRQSIECSHFVKGRPFVEGWPSMHGLRSSKTGNDQRNEAP